MHSTSVLFLLAASAQAAYIVPRQSTCTNSHPNGYTCGGAGSLTKQDNTAILTNANAKTLEVCRDRCLTSSACQSHWYNASTKKCTTSSAGLTKQKFVLDSTSPTTYYNRVCWTGSSCPKPPTTTTTSTPTPTPTPTGLIDGDFENAAQNAGNVWMFQSHGSIGAPGYNSNNAFHFSTPAGGPVEGLDQFFKDTQGKYYLLSFSGKSAGTSNTVNFNLGDLVAYLPMNVISDPSGWNSYSFPVMTTSSNDLYFRLPSDPSSPVTVDLDTFSMTPIANALTPAAGASSLFSNGNFAGGSFDGWNVDYISSGATGAVSPAPAGKAAPFTFTGPGSITDCTISTPYNTVPQGGQDYILSFDYLAPNTSAQARLRVGFGGSTYQLFDIGATTSTWQTYTRRVRPQDSQGTSFAMTFILYDAGQVSVTNMTVVPAAS